MKNFQETADKFAAIEALHRYTSGLDLRNTDLLKSAFIANAISDFRPAGRKAGFEYPVLEGRDIIISTLLGSLNNIDTTHSVSNARVTLNGDKAVLYALVEAQHVPANDHSRNYMMKNQYDVELVRQADAWVIERVTIDNLWRSGDPSVLAGI